MFRRRSLVILLVLSAVIGAGVVVSAQGDEEGWTEPVNLSFSGAAVDPQMITDSNGLIHLFWQDTFAGYVYSRSDGQGWTVPLAVELPFGTRFYDPELQPEAPTPLYTPLLRAGGSGQLYAFWTDGERTLYTSQAAADSAATFAEWSTRQQLAEGALTMDVFVDPAGTIHLSYVRPLESEQFPAGVYYRQSTDEGATWSAPVLLYQSPYFRSLSPDNSRVKVVTDGSGRVVVAWDNRLQARILQSRSADGGLTWDEVTEVDRRLAEDGLEASPPVNVQLAVQLAANGNELHRFWQAGHEGQACVQYHQLSVDGGATWEPRQAMFPAAGTGSPVSGCPLSNHFLGGNDGRLLVFSVTEGGVYALAWSNGQWSLPELQNGLASFQDPETFYPVTLGCHQFAQTGERLLAVGCDVDDNGGKDIWATDVVLAPLVEQLAPAEPPLWQVPEPVASGLETTTDMRLVADADGRLHAFWSQAEGDSSAVYYAGWDGNRWSRPGPVLASPAGGQAEQPAVVLDDRGRLLVAWDSGRAGEIYFSQVEANRAAVAADWAEVMALPVPRPAAGAPDIALDRGGTIYVSYAIGLNEDRGIYLVQSSDDGQSWSEASQVYDAVAAGWEMAGPPHLVIDDSGRLHVVWSQAGLLTGSPALSLHYAHSEDGGASWTEPSDLLQSGSTWNRLLAVGERSLHLLWQVADGQLWHRFSQDGGLNWNQPTRVAGLGEAVGPAAVTVDGAGRPQVLQVRPAGVDSAEPLQIQHWSWADERWLAGESLTPGKGAVSEVGLLAAAVSPGGELGLLFGGPTTEGGAEVLYFSSRMLDLPDVAPTPLPSLTPTPRPQATVSPTPPPLPTATVFFPTEAGGGAALSLPFAGGDTLSGTIIGIVPAGVVVLVTLFVAIRLLRGNRRAR